MALEKLKLKELFREGQRELRVDEAYDYTDLPTTEPVEVHATVTLNSTGASVRGDFTAKIEEPCDRCYDPFAREIRDFFEERYVYPQYTEENPTGGERELHNEDFYDILAPEGILDLKDLVYQLIVLAMGSDRICQKDTCEIKAS